MIAKIKKYWQIGKELIQDLIEPFKAWKSWEKARRRELDLVWEAHELLRALGDPLAAVSPEQLRFKLLEFQVESLRKNKPQRDTTTAARVMAALILDPATPRPSVAKAGLN
ncbi:MAG: hypothetical protein NTY36_01465 [Deltaproteobacteria bacterium]|nr:hypothetical protein [Deltaproteobacteria bacterium]